MSSYTDPRRVNGTWGGRRLAAMSFGPVGGNASRFLWLFGDAGAAWRRGDYTWCWERANHVTLYYALM